MMTFIQRYTDNLKVDLRLGIDKSVGQTGLMINDILAKSHGQVAKDLCDPRQWYHSSTHRELLASLKGELPKTDKDASPLPYTASPNRAKRKVLTSNSHRYHRSRVKQKHEKQSSRKRNVSSTSDERGNYAMPNTTPEQLVPQCIISDAEESNLTLDKMTYSVPHTPLRIPSACNSELRIIDNATVTSFQMREFLDDIVTTDRTGKRSIEIGESFVLPSIPAIRGDFLPHVERTKHQTGATNASTEKQLPMIDTRIDGLEDDHRYIASLAPRGHKKVDDGKKKAVALSFSDDRDETFSKSKVSNSDFIDSWITTLKSPRTNLQHKAGPKNFIQRKAINNKRDLARRYATTRQHTEGSLSIGQARAGQVSQQHNAIRIPDANGPIMPDPRVQSSPKKQQRDDIKPLLKPSSSVKTFAVVDDNLFKKHIATTAVKLNGIETKIDDLFNRNTYLRKSVSRPLIDRSAADKSNNAADEGSSQRDIDRSEIQETKTNTMLHDANKRQDTPSRAPSVVSIEFGGDKNVNSKNKDTNEIVFRGNCFKTGDPYHAYRSTSAANSARKYRIDAQSRNRSSIPTPPRVRVTAVEVLSERPKKAQYLAPKKNSNDTEKNYDNFARKQRSADEMTASQAFLEFGIQPADDADMIATPNTELSCYSNLSEHGYFGDLDSESSDPDILTES